MAQMTATWQALEDNVEGDMRYNYLPLAAGTDISVFHHVPISTKDEKKATIFDYSPRGMKNFFPLKVFDYNCASHDGLMRTLLALLPDFDQLIEKKQYPFFRADINIFMTFFRVS
jgi:hypothetical protein